MAQATEYNSGKLGAFVKMIVSLIKKNPQYMDNHDFLMATLKLNIPALKIVEICINCGASMKEYLYILDAWDALLLLRMADAVVLRRNKGMSFTEANQIRIPELVTTHAIKCRTTHCSKLGLLAQLRGQNNNRIPGTWVITRRGWEAIAGRPVPKMVKVWRKNIEERYDVKITLAEALKGHVEYVSMKLRKGRTPRQDHREEVKAYNPAQWAEYTIHEGAII